MVWIDYIHTDDLRDLMHMFHEYGRLTDANRLARIVESRLTRGYVRKYADEPYKVTWVRFLKGVW